MSVPDASSTAGPTGLSAALALGQRMLAAEGAEAVIGLNRSLRLKDER
ncbi:MAG: hypothetical protein M3Y59_15025 [Myxococcota bacterium]|nr:hypothetical protein [Myxococcota bacterium]